MRAAKFHVAPALLQERLGMPDSSRIIAAGYDVTKDTVVIVATDDCLPDAPDPHDCDPILTEKRIEWDWNVS